MEKKVKHITIWVVNLLILSVIFIESITFANSLMKVSKSNSTGFKYDQLDKQIKYIDSIIYCRMPQEYIFNPQTIQSPFEIHQYIEKLEQKADRQIFIVKGIVAEKTTYAILQDQSGRSFICKSGDSVNSVVVVNISKEYIVLKDNSGIYTINTSSK